jgi:hypothetical protein
MEIIFGLYGNDAAGFQYVVKRDERLSGGYTINTLSDFKFQNKMLEARKNKYLVERQELQLEGSPAKLKVLSIKLVGMDERPLPFSVLYKMPG